MLFALSFVAPEDVHASFEELADNAPEVLTQLFQYWKDTYIGRQRRNHRTQARFPIAIWYVKDRIEDGLPRMKNSVEGWHRSFQQTVDCHHPTVYNLVASMREQESTEQRIQRYLAGDRQPKATKAKYIAVNRRLCACWLLMTIHLDWTIYD